MTQDSNKPVLVIMAAGMGSRYGGLKQIEPVTDKGEIIVDFSLYDAHKAGFEKAIFIIKKEMEEDVRALIDEGAGTHMEIVYAFQELSDLPEGYSVPKERVKPWGTSHAILSARKIIDGPFAVINADDYYGPDAFSLIYEYLLNAKDDNLARYAMVGYELSKTLTENGTVARGVCVLDEYGNLAGVDERIKLAWRDDEIAYEENGKWIGVDINSTVSMNFWGFTEGFISVLLEGFPTFLDTALKSNPLKGEYLLPQKVDEMIKTGQAKVKVLNSSNRWYGVTYKEDKDYVVSSLQALKDIGLYPDKLWK